MTALEQQHQALALGNQTRSYRARVRQEFRETDLRGGLDIIADMMHIGQPRLLDTLSIGVLLGWVKGLRVRRAEKICEEAKVSYFTPLGKMTMKDRRAILHQIHTWRY